MAYVTLSGVQDVFGEENVAVWSDLAQAGELDEDRVDRAIAWADEDINSRFRGSRYDVPLPATAQVEHWGAVLAGVWLYRARGMRDTDPEDKITALKKEIEDEIADVLAGARNLDTSNYPRAPFITSEA